MMTVSQLFIYPIKSLGGIAIDSGEVSPRGFENDRRWMLVDDNNLCLTQRDLATMALLRPQINNDRLVISHYQDPSLQLQMPLSITEGELIEVKIWNDNCQALVADDRINKWFSQQLQHSCRLVYMPEQTHRRVEEKYAHHGEITSFSDAYPFLMIGQSSLDDLNHRMKTPLPINRFRPNIVFTGGRPYEEDEMEEFIINSIHFYGVKLCARCNIPTIDQDTTEKNKEPNTTFARYRLKNNNVYFGQNLLHKGDGKISVGDLITITKKKSPEFPLAAAR
jgi:uncharacterized protein